MNIRKMIAATLVGVSAIVATGATGAYGMPPIGTVPETWYVNVVGATSNSITITWGGNDPEAHYTIGWQDRDRPSVIWESAGADYSIWDSPLTLTGLTAGHSYDVYVVALHGTGAMVRGATLQASAAPGRVQTTTTVVKSIAAPKTCTVKTMASKTAANMKRVNSKQMLVKGSMAYWTGIGWQNAPEQDYALTLQRKVGNTWTYVTRIKPYHWVKVIVARGTYRLVFPGLCNQPAAPSASSAVLR